MVQWKDNLTKLSSFQLWNTPAIVAFFNCILKSAQIAKDTCLRFYVIVNWTGWIFVGNFS